MWGVSVISVEHTLDVNGMGCEELKYTVNVRILAIGQSKYFSGQKKN